MPYIESQAMFAHGQQMAGANVRGVLPAEERTRHGARPAPHGREPGRARAGGSFAIILGGALARELNVRVGDCVILIAPEGTATPTGVVPRMRRFRVVGLFESGMYEFDRGLALVDLARCRAAVSQRRRGDGAAPGLRRPAARADAWCARRRCPWAAPATTSATGPRTTPTSSARSRSPSR